MRNAAIVFLLLIFMGCSRSSPVFWEDGNYRVYSRVSGEVIMGYYMGDGAVMGLSDPTVTGAGSDARFVTFKCDADNLPLRFYYIEKKPNEAGEVSGPYSATEYPAIEKAKMLPPHTWNMKP